jgi:protein involved in polysaccharide export with SLBB domain
MLLAACAAPGRPPAGIHPAAGSSGVLHLTAEAIERPLLNRSPHPQANRAFLLIDGAPYYRLGPGDVIRISFPSGLPIEPFTEVIDPAGNIQISPLLPGERIHLGGLALPQAELRLSEALARVLRRPQVSLQVLEYHAAPVLVMGEFRLPGASVLERSTRAHLRGRETLLEFIFAHVSPGDEADLSAVVVTDDEGRSAAYDLTQVIYAGHQEHNPVLDRGDVITIPSLAHTRQHIYVLGQVQIPSILPPHRGLTLIDALTRAGGPTQRADRTWITLVRGRGQEAELHRIAYGELLRRGRTEWDVPILPGDIIYVDQGGYSRAVEFFRDTWTVLQTALVVLILSERF